MAKRFKKQQVLQGEDTAHCWELPSKPGFCWGDRVKIRSKLFDGGFAYVTIDIKVIN